MTRNDEETEVRKKKRKKDGLEGGVAKRGRRRLREGKKLPAKKMRVFVGS